MKYVREGKIQYDFTHMWNIKSKQKTNEQTKQTLTCRYREKSSVYQSWEGKMGKGVQL